jgi:hypothetical protein
LNKRCADMAGARCQLNCIPPLDGLLTRGRTSGSTASCSWARIGTAKAIANPARVSNNRLFIVSSRCFRMGLSPYRPGWICRAEICDSALTGNITRVKIYRSLSGNISRRVSVQCSPTLIRQAILAFLRPESCRCES